MTDDPFELDGIDLFVLLALAWMIAVGGGFIGVTVFDAYQRLSVRVERVSESVSVVIPVAAPAEESVSVVIPVAAPAEPDLKQLIRNAAMLCGVEGDLMIALVERESGFQIDAVGMHGEIGLVQIKLGTAKDVSPTLDVVGSPFDNVLAGACYLRNQLRGSPTRENWREALHRYNGGASADVSDQARAYAEWILNRAGI